MKKNLFFLFALIAIGAISAHAGVTIIDETHLENADFTAGVNVIDTYTVAVGDMIAVAVGVNGGSKADVTDLTFGGSANFAVGGSARLQSGGGPATTYWYGTATSAGTVELSYDYEDIQTALAGFQLRAGADETLQLGAVATDANNGTSPNPSPTLTYDFGSVTYSSGIMIEGFSSYNVFTTIPGTVDAQSNLADKFGAGYSTFSTAKTGTELTSVYGLTVDGSDQSALVGMAFVAWPGYIWTGTSDGNWSNALNWVNNNIPVDQYTNNAAKDMGLNGEMTIIFSGDNMPSSNEPGLGGWTYGSDDRSTPFLDLRSGGTLSIDYVSSAQDGYWVEPYDSVPTILTIGDGVSGGNEDVTLDVSDDLTFSRVEGTTNSVVINADGTLDIEGNMATAHHPDPNDVSSTLFDLNGGTLIVGGDLTLRGSATRFILTDGAQITVTGGIEDPDSSSAYFDFQGPGTEVTATYGVTFADITAVRSAIGTTFRSSNGGQVSAVDLGGGYKVHPPTGTLLIIQ